MAATPTGRHELDHDDRSSRVPAPMRKLLLTVVLAGPLAVLAQPGAPPPEGHGAAGDPLRTPQCRQALESLQAQEAAAAAAAAARASAVDGRRARTPDARLEASRRDAAAACLRSREDPPPERQPWVQPPIAVRPAPTVRPGPTLPLPRAAPPPVARPGERPRFITTCDAIGCWADDGSRLDRVGPNLRGPRGPCTLQGTLLTCP
jgi:hypothetical protein